MKNREELNLFHGMILHSPVSVTRLTRRRGIVTSCCQPVESGQHFCSIIVMAGMQIWKKSSMNFILLSKHKLSHHDIKHYKLMGPRNTYHNSIYSQSMRLIQCEV